MRQSGTILTIGIVLTVIPFLGFPSAWKNFLVTVLGLWLCGLVVSARLGRHRTKKMLHKRESRTSASFVENQAPLNTPKESVSQNTHDQFPQA